MSSFYFHLTIDFVDGARWCVFVAGIYPSRTQMSGSFESVR